MTVADLGDLDRCYGIAGQLFPGRKAATAIGEDRLWINQPDSFPTAILSGPAARSMRTDARFLGLADRIGLLDYWRSGRLPDFCTKAHDPVCARISARRA
jgi:hypothetical protein